MGSHDESKPDDTRTDLGSVSNDNKEEIDIELAKSIEKLVEEETNVAKAAMGKQEIPVRSTAAGNAGKKRCCPDEDSGFAGFSRYPASGKTGGEGKTAEKHAESRHGEKSCDRNKGVFRNTGNRTGKSTPRNG